MYWLITAIIKVEILLAFTLIIIIKVFTAILNDFIVKEVDSKDSGSVLVRFVKKLFQLVGYLVRIN